MSGVNYKPTSAAPTTSFTTAIGYNKRRKKLIVYNTGSVDCRLSLTGSGSGVLVVAGGHLAWLDSPPINAIQAKSASGTGELVFWEG